MIGNTFHGIAAAIRSRSTVFWGLTAGVALFNLAAPIAILSIARKPPDFFTFNPWLSQLPGYLASDEDSLAKKLAFLSNMAIAWFSADNPVEGLEWGFIIDVPTLFRTAFTALLFGAYFALWSLRRSQVQACGLGLRAARPAGVAGAATSVLGLTTGPCSLAGCGVPVLPIVGLAFTGLSSGTLSLISMLSRISIAVVLFAMTLALLWFGWRVGTTPPPTG
jgi:hypothetical protein